MKNAKIFGLAHIVCLEAELEVELHTSSYFRLLVQNMINAALVALQLCMHDAALQICLMLHDACRCLNQCVALWDRCLQTELLGEDKSIIVWRDREGYKVLAEDLSITFNNENYVVISISLQSCQTNYVP